jgi:hypothetical protein
MSRLADAAVAVAAAANAAACEGMLLLLLLTMGLEPVVMWGHHRPLTGMVPGIRTCRQGAMSFETAPGLHATPGRQTLPFPRSQQVMLQGPADR